METRTQFFGQRDFEARAVKDLFQVIEERRATNHFTSEPVPDSDLEEILYAAAQAPSGYNLQPWRFIVVQTEEGRHRLREVAFDQEKITEAPVVLIFVGMKEQTKKLAREVLEDGVRHGLGRPEAIDEQVQEATAFISNLGLDLWVNRHVMIAFSFAMLTAETLGYDTAPMEGFDAEAVKRAFNIPKEGEVIALLAIGRAQEPDKLYPGRFPLDRLVYCERFGQPWQATVQP